MLKLTEPQLLPKKILNCPFISFKMSVNDNVMFQYKPFNAYPDK